MQTGSVKT